MNGLDHDLDALLSMNGVEMVLENGYWIKIQARMASPGEHVPHGVRYSLTLHDQRKQRLIGYDNAHAVKTRKKKFESRRVQWDHQHRLETVMAYQFESAEKLLVDFWNDVYQLLYEKNT